jgi:hypothetical protein
VREYRRSSAAQPCWCRVQRRGITRASGELGERARSEGEAASASLQKGPGHVSGHVSGHRHVRRETLTIVTTTARCHTASRTTLPHAGCHAAPAPRCRPQLRRNSTSRNVEIVPGVFPPLTCPRRNLAPRTSHLAPPAACSNSQLILRSRAAPCHITHRPQHRAPRTARSCSRAGSCLFRYARCPFPFAQQLQLQPPAQPQRRDEPATSTRPVALLCSLSSPPRHSFTFKSHSFGSSIRRPGAPRLIETRAVFR